MEHEHTKSNFKYNNFVLVNTISVKAQANNFLYISVTALCLI